jgi:hypothetical protein
MARFKPQRSAATQARWSRWRGRRRRPPSAALHGGLPRDPCTQPAATQSRSKPSSARTQAPHQRWPAVHARRPAGASGARRCRHARKDSPLMKTCRASYIMRVRAVQLHTRVAQRTAGFKPHLRLGFAQRLAQRPRQCMRRGQVARQRLARKGFQQWPVSVPAGRGRLPGHRGTGGPGRRRRLRPGAAAGHAPVRPGRAP